MRPRGLSGGIEEDESSFLEPFLTLTFYFPSQNPGCVIQENIHPSMWGFLILYPYPWENIQPPHVKSFLYSTYIPGRIFNHPVGDFLYSTQNASSFFHQLSHGLPGLGI
jgi:hypothetical protein